MQLITGLGMLGAQTYAHLTVAKKLKEYAERVAATVRHDCSEVMSEAAQHFSYALNDTRESYKDCLSQTIDKTDLFVRQRLAQLESMVQDIETRNYPKLQSLLKKVQLQLSIGGDIFFAADRCSHLISSSPSCVAPSQETIIFLRAIGHFPIASRPGARPILALNKRVYQPESIKLDELIFPIPAQHFSSSTPTYLTGKLVVPHPRGFPTCFLDPILYCYPIPLGILPETPGEIAIEHTKTVFKDGEPQVRRGPSFNLNSSRKGGGSAKDLNQRYVLEVTPGWKVLRGTKRFESEHLRGKYSFKWEEETDTSVACRAITIFTKRKHQSGQICGRISFQEYKQRGIKEIVAERTVVQLKWGESKTFPYSAGTWKVHFTPFDKSPSRTFIGPALDNPFLEVKTTGEILEIRCKSPASVKLTALTLTSLARLLGDKESSPVLLRSRL